MKRVVLLLTLALCTTGLFAQESDSNEIKTIFNTKIHSIRGFAGPVLNVSMIAGDVAFINGGGVCALFNDKFYFGVSNMELNNSVESGSEHYKDMNISFNSHSLWTGYIFNSRNPIHVNAGLQLGKGEISLSGDELTIFDTSDNVLVVNPIVELELNITKFLRLGVGANYRYITGLDDLKGYDSMDFSSPGAFMSLKFGWFK